MKSQEACHDYDSPLPAGSVDSTILVYGAGGLGIEIAKNLVLSGCKELVLQDTKLTSYYDLSSQFYLNESDIGKNRAECCIKKLQN